MLRILRWLDEKLKFTKYTWLRGLGDLLHKVLRTCDQACFIWRKPRVYLAGTIQDADDGGVAWREKISEKLAEMGVQVLDPTELEAQDFGSMEAAKSTLNSLVASGKRDEFQNYMREVRRRDMEAVYKSDFLIVFGHKTGGTICEMWEQLEHRLRPVYVMSTDNLQDWNFWMLSRLWDSEGEVFGSWPQLESFVRGRYGKR